MYIRNCAVSKRKIERQPGKKRKINSSVQFSFGQIMHEKKQWVCYLGDAMMIGIDVQANYLCRFLGNFRWGGWFYTSCNSAWVLIGLMFELGHRDSIALWFGTSKTNGEWLLRCDLWGLTQSEKYWILCVLFVSRAWTIVGRFIIGRSWRNYGHFLQRDRVCLLFPAFRAMEGSETWNGTVIQSVFAISSRAEVPYAMSCFSGKHEGRNALR